MFGIIKDKVGVASAQLFTWEVVTGFEEELSEPDLLRKLREECPGLFDKEGTSSGFGRTFKFWNMISFNGAEGRRHRYLVAVRDGEIQESRWKYDRFLPPQISLFGTCDKIMRETDKFENFRYAALVNGTLFILVFMEGRLCHWSEESGYGNDDVQNVHDAERRLLRFDEFLKRDELFSRVEQFAVSCDWIGNFCCFRAAAQDPFWKRLDLDEGKGLKPREKLRLGLGTFAAILVFGCAGVWHLTGEIRDNPQMVLQDAPLLDPPLLPFPDNLEEREIAELIEFQSLQKVGVSKIIRSGKGDECESLSVKVQGLVAEKIAQVILPDQSKRWIRVGDSLDGFQVMSIGRDRVRFNCGGRDYDLFSGK